MQLSFDPSEFETRSLSIWGSFFDPLISDSDLLYSHYSPAEPVKTFFENSLDLDWFRRWDYSGSVVECLTRD